MASKQLDDDSEVTFEITKRNHGKTWTLIISCPDVLSDQEFGASCIAFGEDVLDGKIDIGIENSDVQ